MLDTISSVHSFLGSRFQKLRREIPIRIPLIYDSSVSRCSHSRSVHFPSEEELISSFHEAPASPFQRRQHPAADDDCPEAVHPDEIKTAYGRACVQFKTSPNGVLSRQIECFHRVANVRQEGLSLKGERVTYPQMEALEEIFRRVQFESLDFEYTFLDDDCVISLAEMLEFYDSTQKLNLSFNKQITQRGWTALFKAVKNAHSLQLLNLRYTSLTDKSLPQLCRTLRAQPQPALTCLHLENVSLSGKNLLLVVCALKTNSSIKELYLGENNLQHTDGAHLYQLIISNTSITTLDLRNNELHDGGVRHICDALRHAEACKRSALQALVLWNNRLTGACMDTMTRALMVNHRLETLNIGSNNIGELGITNLKPALLSAETGLHRLGLQSTNMNNQCAIMLAECMADNNVMVRIDLRDNPGVGSAGLLALHSAMRHNKSLTLLNLDQRLAVPTSAKDDFRRVFDEIREMCERNKKDAIDRMNARAVDDVNSESTETALPSEDVGCIGEEKFLDGVLPEQGTSETPLVGGENVDAAENNNSGTVEPSPLIDEPPKCCEENAQEPAVHPRAPPRNGCARLARSASLTCSDLLPDVTIQERLREMSGSTHSLDETGKLTQPEAAQVAPLVEDAIATAIPTTSSPADVDDSHAESVKTIKKSVAPTFAAAALQHKAEWGSLPSLPASTASPPSTPRSPVVKKLRRFSVSPTTSTFDLTGPTLKPGASSTPPLRPLSLPLGSPCTSTESPNGSQSAPIFSSSLPLALTYPSSSSVGMKFNAIPTVPERTSADCDEEKEREREKREKEEEEARLKKESAEKDRDESDDWVKIDKEDEDGSRNSDDDLERERKADAEREKNEALANDVKAVVTDLVNYVVYEETSVAERKRSMLLQASCFERPDPARLLAAAQEQELETPSPITQTPTTPSRMLSIAEELSNETEETVVESVVRGIVRQVLKSEKEQLRSTLDRKRNRLLSNTPGSSQNSPGGGSDDSTPN